MKAILFVHFPASIPTENDTMGDYPSPFDI